jgi:hypothetical protein
MIGSVRDISPLAVRFVLVLVGFLCVEAGIYSARSALGVAVIVVMIEGATGSRSPVSWLIRAVRGVGGMGISITVARRIYAVAAAVGALAFVGSAFSGTAWSLSAIAMGCVAFVCAAVLPPRVSHV